MGTILPATHGTTCIKYVHLQRVRQCQKLIKALTGFWNVSLFPRNVTFFSMKIKSMQTTADFIAFQTIYYTSEMHLHRQYTQHICFDGFDQCSAHNAINIHKSKIKQCQTEIAKLSRAGFGRIFCFCFQILFALTLLLCHRHQIINLTK